MGNFFQIYNQDAVAIGDAIVADVDTGAGTATLLMYTGSQPANPDVAITSQTLIATFTLQKPSFGAFSVGSTFLTKDNVNPPRASLLGVPLSAPAVAAGTITWFRILDADGVAAIDGSVGTSNANIILDTNVVALAGFTLRINSLVMTQPSSPGWGDGNQQISSIRQSAAGVVV